jgi:dolichol kinase
MDLETRRQLLHMSGFMVAIYVKWAGISYGFLTTFITLGVVLTTGYVLASVYKRGVEIPIVSQLVDMMERPEVIRESPGKGALSFFLGAILTLVIFRYDINVVSASIAILALGDSISTLVGINYGGHKIWYNRKKSWEGTLSGALFASLGTSLLIRPEIAVVGAFGGMIIETLPLKVDDNIAVPLGAGFAMSLVLYLQS